MANAVIPLQQGYDYNARFFWFKSCRLFRTHTKVKQVGYELDKIKSFDDTVVFYAEPILDERGDEVSIDVFQVKFHVDQRRAFTWKDLIDPAFIGAQSISLLQRVHNAQMNFSSQGIYGRVYLLSTWGLDANDLLGLIISKNGGEIRLDTLFDGTTDKSKMGEVRKEWRHHLGLSNDDELKKVLRPLRIVHSACDLQTLNEILDIHLEVAGLVPIEVGKRVQPYDDLIRRLHAEGQNLFTADQLKSICENENLWRGKKSESDEAKKIGIRSFIRHAEHIEDEVDQLLCLVRHFDNRFIKDASIWNTAIVTEIAEFLKKNTWQGTPFHIYLDTHSSIAFFAGYCLEAKSAISVAPVQTTRSGKIVWQPDQTTPSAEVLGELESIEMQPLGQDVAIAISITHDVTDDVKEYVSKGMSNVRRILSWKIKPRTGSTSIIDANHAFQVAQELSVILKQRTVAERKATLHIFSAAPNSLLFFLGQIATGFGRCILYEFDFDHCTPGAYQPAIMLPFKHERMNE